MTNFRKLLIFCCFSTLFFSSATMAAFNVMLDHSNLFRIERGGDGSIEIHPEYKKPGNHSTEQDDSDDNDGSGGTTARVRKIFKQTEGETSTENKPLWCITPVEGQNHLLQITDCESGHSIIISVPEGVDWNYGSLVAFLQGNGESSLPSFSIINSLSDPTTLESIHYLLQEPQVTGWCDLRAWSCFSDATLAAIGWVVVMELNPAPQQISANVHWQFPLAHYDAHYASFPFNDEPQQSPQSSPLYTLLYIEGVPAFDILQNQPATHPVSLSLPNTPYTNSLYTSNQQSSGDGSGSGTSKYIVFSLFQRLFSSGSFSDSSASGAGYGSSSTEGKSKKSVVIPGLLLQLTPDTLHQEKLFH